MWNVFQVVQYILDRNTCLLPSYFAVNEITKLCSDDRPWPHWVGILMLGIKLFILLNHYPAYMYYVAVIT